MSQAALNVAMTVSPDGLSRTVTLPCPNGGSMSMTFSSPTSGLSSSVMTSSRIDYIDCRSQTVTINGDPALMMDGTYTFVMGAGNSPSSMTSTTRMTGGLRFDAAGTAGRARYDCSTTTSIEFGIGGAFVFTTTMSSGTITWEQPLGTVMTQPCGR